MRNYELVQLLYRSLLTVEHYGPCHTSDILISESIKMVEKERPEIVKMVEKERFEIKNTKYET